MTEETKAIRKWPKHGVLDSTKMFVKDYWAVASSRGLESSLLVKICLVLLANCLGSGREKPMGERERGWTERSRSVSLQYHFLQLKRPELTEFLVSIPQRQTDRWSTSGISDWNHGCWLTTQSQCFWKAVFDWHEEEAASCMYLWICLCAFVCVQYVCEYACTCIGEVCCGVCWGGRAAVSSITAHAS